MNKTLIVIAALFSSLPAFAVITKNCPESLSFKLDNINALEVHTIMSNIGADRFAANSELTQEVAGLKDLKLFETSELKLISKQRSTCVYQKIDGEDLIEVTLDGSTTNRNARIRTYLGLTRNGQSYGHMIYNDLEDLQQGLVIAAPESSIYFMGKICSWTDCAPDFIRIGSATLTIE